MSYDKKLCDPLTEWILEEGWQINRRFMREIENEYDLRGIPINILLASKELILKWLEFASKN